MLRVCQFDSGIETGDWIKIQLVTKTGQRVSWVTFLSLAHKHLSYSDGENVAERERIKRILGRKELERQKSKLSLVVRDYVSIQGFTESTPK